MVKQGRGVPEPWVCICGKHQPSKGKWVHCGVQSQDNGSKPRVQLKPQTCIYSIAHSPPQTQFLETVCPGALEEDQCGGGEGGQLSSHAKKVSFVIIYPDGNLSKTS